MHTREVRKQLLTASFFLLQAEKCHIAYLVYRVQKNSLHTHSCHLRFGAQMF